MFAQFTEETGPIVLANTFLGPKERTESFLALLRRQAEFMKAQPGFVSLQAAEFPDDIVSYPHIFEQIAV